MIIQLDLDGSYKVSHWKTPPTIPTPPNFKFFITLVCPDKYNIHEYYERVKQQRKI